MRLTDEQRQIVTDNHGLIEKYLYDHRATMKYEDWYDVLAIALCKAACEHDFSRGKFSTLAYACFNKEVASVQKYLRSSKQSAHNDMLYFGDYENENGEKFLDYLEIFVPRRRLVEEEALVTCMVEEYFKKRKLGKRAREIFCLFLQGYKLNEVVTMIGCSRERASRIRREFATYLKTGKVNCKKYKAR